MINIQLKPQKENTYCPLCFSIVTKTNIDKHLDEKHPRNGYIAKKNIPLTIVRHVLDYLCPDCYLTYEDIDKLKEHFTLVHHFSIREEEIPEEKPIEKKLNLLGKHQENQKFLLFQKSQNNLLKNP